MANPSRKDLERQLDGETDPIRRTNLLFELALMNDRDKTTTRVAIGYYRQALATGLLDDSKRLRAMAFLASSASKVGELDLAQEMVNSLRAEGVDQSHQGLGGVVTDVAKRLKRKLGREG